LAVLALVVDVIVGVLVSSRCARTAGAIPVDPRIFDNKLADSTAGKRETCRVDVPDKRIEGGEWAGLTCDGGAFSRKALRVLVGDCDDGRVAVQSAVPKRAPLPERIRCARGSGGGWLCGHVDAL